MDVFYTHTHKVIHTFDSLVSIVWVIKLKYT